MLCSYWGVRHPSKTNESCFARWRIATYCPTKTRVWIILTHEFLPESAKNVHYPLSFFSLFLSFGNRLAMSNDCFSHIPLHVVPTLVMALKFDRRACSCHVRGIHGKSQLSASPALRGRYHTFPCEIMRILAARQDSWWSSCLFGLDVSISVSMECAAPSFGLVFSCCWLVVSSDV